MSQNKKQPKADVAKRPARQVPLDSQDFRRSLSGIFWEDLDKRFFMIVLVSWAFVYTLATILGNTEFDDAAQQQKHGRTIWKNSIRLKLSNLSMRLLKKMPARNGGEEEDAPQEDARAERDRGRQGEARGPSAQEVAEVKKRRCS